MFAAGGSEPTSLPRPWLSPGNGSALAQKGKDATQFASSLASYAARAVKCGRRITGQIKPKDAMNEATQQRHGFCVGKLPDFSTLSENPLSDALIDNTRSPVPARSSSGSISHAG